MKHFFVLFGEDGVSRVEEFQPGATPTREDLLRWVYADIRRPDSYWGHDEDGKPLDTDEIHDLDLDDPTPDVHVLCAVGWDEEPATWACVEAPSKERLREAYPDIF